MDNDKLDVKVEKLKDENVASMITLSEEITPYAGNDEDVRYVQAWIRLCSEPDATLILNANHPLVQYVVEHKDGENTEMYLQTAYMIWQCWHTNR